MVWPCLQAIQEVPNSKEIGTAHACGGTTVLDATSPIAAFARKTGTAHASTSTAVPCPQLPF